MPRRARRREAHSRALLFFSRPLDGRVGPAPGSWQAKRGPGFSDRYGSEPSRSNQARPNQVKRFSLLVEPVEQDLVIGALGQLDLLGYAPGERLLVQRDVAPVLFLGDFVGLGDHLVALGPVGFEQNPVAQVIDFRIAVVAEIVVAAIALLVAA